MGQSSQNERQLFVPDKTVVADRITSFLRQIHPSKTAECVSADTGIAAATVAKMVWGERRGHATFGAIEQSDGVPHAAIERSEPVPCRFRPG